VSEDLKGGGTPVTISGGWFPAKLVAAFCAVSAFYLPGTAAWAQPSGGPVIKADGAQTVNKYYTYPNIDIWDDAKWPMPQAKPIAKWIESHEKDARPEYVVKEKYKGIKQWVGNPDYAWKTDSITDPEVIAELTRMGLHTELREGGGIQIIITPEKVLADKDRKVPVVIVPHVITKWDPFWAMQTLAHFKKYNELLAQHGDFILDYFILDKSLAGNGQSASGNGGAHADTKHIYLDVSPFAEQGTKIASVPGLNWSDDAGKKVDPDAQVEHVASVPVLNIAGKTATGPNFSLSPRYRGQFPGIDVPFNEQLVVHSPFGQHWMEGVSFAHAHPGDDDPAIQEHFEQMGLVGGVADYKGKRYFFYSPRIAAEQHRNLPLILLNTEVGYANPYGISDAYGRYLDWFKLAARGDLNVLVFNLQGGAVFGGAAPMDAAYDLIKELEKTNPIDPSRIYVTGHSHAGHETREFAYRHPDMVAAAAPLGNSAGIAAPPYSHEAIVGDDQRIEAWSKIDMPLITLGAVGELMSPHTTPSLIMPNYDLFIEAWQRRLKASHAPMQSREQIMAAEHSKDYVTRLFGLPNNGSSLQVIDGVEHYIIDLKNADGRDHMRFVAIDNIFHTPTPTMPQLAWTFMSRFARDQKTGKVIELY
jgi:hypothetical protein